DLLRHAVGRHDRQRMRMKRDHRRRTPQLARALHAAARALLMPDVHAGEVPDRRHAPAWEIGLAEGVVEDEHVLGGRSVAHANRNAGAGSDISSHDGAVYSSTAA